MRRVSGNGLIGPRTTYSGPCISRILVNTFCYRTTSSEFFIFFLDFTIYMCIYIQHFLYIHTCAWNRFHWILLIIEIDRCRVRVYDSLRKPTYYYQDLINIIQKAWARFLEKHIEISSPPAPLEFTTNWPVRIHIAHLLSFL